MINAITEMLLGEFFTYTAVCGKLVKDGQKLFNRLADTFLLPESGRRRLYALAESGRAKDIKTHADYMQFRRIEKYSEVTGEEFSFTREDGEIISIKGKALEKVNSLGFKISEDDSETLIYRRLCESANRGSITALRVLGTLQCEGAFIEKNAEEGKKNLEKAAKWNSEEGILAALYYDEQNRQVNLNRLYTVTAGTAYEGIIPRVEREYKLKAEGKTEGGELIKKAIGAGVLKAEIYSPQYARFIFSSVIKTKDKERALFSANKDILAATAELPLKLAYAPLEYDPSAFDTLAEGREREYMERCAANSDLRTGYSYRPLCVCSDSEYQCKRYSAAFKAAFRGAHIEHIKVADLSGYDLEPTKNNIFIRNCDEDKNNVYFLYFRGEIDGGVLEAVKGFLSSEKRKKFRLLTPAAALDLSPVLPVCFCDKQNAKFLKPYCDVIYAPPVSAAEKPALIEDIFTAKQKLYGVGKIDADDTAVKRLTSLSIDRAESVIDKIVRFNRKKGKPFTITAELLKDEERTASNAYGFGGSNNENK